jgi:hypothetical protein
LSGLKNIVAIIFNSNCHDNRNDNATSASFKLKSKMDLKNIFETGKPHLKELIMINNHLVVLIQHDPGELRGL